MKANILVIDDNFNNLRLLMDVLNEHGYKVRPASEVDFALKSVLTTPPDLILLDVMLPEMDGFEICRRLKADPHSRDIPVIFLSACDKFDDKMRGFEVGGVDYITKPFQSLEVLVRVKTQLTIRQQQQTLQKKNSQLQEEIVKRQQAEEHLMTMNQQLEEVNDRLREANAAKDSFFSIIAHDLRSPFTTFIGLTETLVEDFDRYTEEKLKSHIQRLHSSSKQMYALLTNLLTWSRLERGLMAYEPIHFALIGLIEKSIHLFRSQTRSKRITIKNRIPHDIHIYADFNMFDTIVRNLLSNAIKFTKPGGAIEVSLLLQDEARVEIAVSDSGVGMTQECIDALFRIDRKYSRPGTNGEQGSGLGLILCKELIEKNGGMILVESQLNKGSRFIITLPGAS